MKNNGIFNMGLSPDMKKGTDTQTLPAEIFENCGNFSTVKDYLHYSGINLGQY